MRQKRGRYAPSPTGYLHVGNARTALVAWLSVRSVKGTFIWRLEDLDGPRVVPGMAKAAEEDLKWLGLDWDEGPGMGGPAAPYVQSLRHSYYEEALKVLLEKERLFPCNYSRKDIQNLSTAPHGSSLNNPYPISLRPQQLKENWFQELEDKNNYPPEASSCAAIRFKVSNESVVFYDRIYGKLAESVQDTVGDFVLKRRDGCMPINLL